MDFLMDSLQKVLGYECVVLPLELCNFAMPKTLEEGLWCRSNDKGNDKTP